MRMHSSVVFLGILAGCGGDDAPAIAGRTYRMLLNANPALAVWDSVFVLPLA